MKIQTEHILNWGESKGLQADATLIYMTKTLLDWYSPSVRLKKKISQETLHKFYVAVTRAKYVVGLIVPNNFDNSIISLSFGEKFNSTIPQIEYFCGIVKFITTLILSVI